MSSLDDKDDVGEGVSLLNEDRLNREQQTINADDDDDEEDALEYQAETVITILKPVALTMLFVVWAVKTVTIPASAGGAGGVSIIVYNESAGDSTGTKLGGAILNAIVFVVAIALVTFVFVLLYKYRCLKAIYAWLIGSSIIMLGSFGGTLMYLLLEAWNLPLDWLTFVFALWNFAVVGIVTVFWHGPTKVNQGYLILISGLMAIFFTRLPEWTTFAILAVVAIYDLIAVLCPKGPLKMLVEMAQERKEPIPALLYNASVYMMMADQESQTQQKRKGVKLGLGDFVFYSVLIGRAAMFNMITVFTCFIAIITGLFCTLLLLAIFRKALPALPISIAFGILFYFVSRIFLYPFVVELGSHQVFV